MREALIACVLVAACGANAAARPLAATREAVLSKGFTIDLKIDCGSVKGDEALYEAGPVRLALRLAGADPALARYDRAAGNYLTFPLADGAPGSFVNWTNEPDKLYEGLSVPMVTSWKNGRRLIGGVRGLDADYEVKVVAYYDAKADATLFDAEVAGQRTLICRREGRFTE